MERKLLEERKSGTSQLQLWENYIDGRRELELVINGVFIMATYNGLSSELLVRHGLDKLELLQDVNLLIGGLGMGFSVKEACLSPKVCQVDVVEIEPVVAQWNRQYFNQINKCCLDDPRVSIEISDFFDFVTNTSNKYNLIAMDIDNGPMMLVQENNQRVYGEKFFLRVKNILKPGGVFAVWSCLHEPKLLKAGEKVFSHSTYETVYEEHNGRRESYFLYFMSDLPAAARA